MIREVPAGKNNAWQKWGAEDPLREFKICGIDVELI